MQHVQCNMVLVYNTVHGTVCYVPYCSVSLILLSSCFCCCHRFPFSGTMLFLCTRVGHYADTVRRGQTSGGVVGQSIQQQEEGH